MKKIHIILLFLVGLVFSCTISDDIVQVAFNEKSGVPDFTIDDTKDLFIDKGDPQAGEVGFSFTVGQGEITSMDLKVVYEGKAGDQYFTTAQASITSFPHAASLSVNQVIDLFPELGSADDLVAGDVFTFYCDVTLANGKVYAGVDEDGPNMSGDIENSVLFTPFLNYTVACGLQAPFTGQYQLTDPLGNWGDQVVTVVEDGATERSFVGTFFGFEDRPPFKFNLVCDEVVMLQTSSGLGCGGPAWEFGPDPNKVAPFDLADDSVIVLDFVDNNQSACGGGPSPYQMTLTKL